MPHTMRDQLFVLRADQPIRVYGKAQWYIQSIRGTGQTVGGTMNIKGTRLELR